MHDVEDRSLHRYPVDSRFSVRLLSAGSLIAAVATSSCCFIPLGLVLLGLGGAWISKLTFLAPYQPYFVAATAACLAGGFFLSYRRPDRSACAESSACGSSRAVDITRVTLWSATILVAAALIFPYALRALL